MQTACVLQRWSAQAAHPLSCLPFRDLTRAERPSAFFQLAGMANKLLPALLRARLSPLEPHDATGRHLMRVNFIGVLATFHLFYARRPRARLAALLVSVLSWVASSWLALSRERWAMTLRNALKHEASTLLQAIEAMPPASTTCDSSAQTEREALPPSDAIRELASSMALAHTLYGGPRDPVAAQPPLLAPPPILLPPAIGHGMAPPPPPPPPPPPRPPTAPASVRLPTAHELLGGLAGLRKKVDDNGEGGPSACKKSAADLAGARGLGVTLADLSAVTLRATAGRAAELAAPAPSPKLPTPEAFRARSRLKAVAAAPSRDKGATRAKRRPLASSGRRLPLSPLACNAQAAATAQKKACSTFDDRKENVAPALIVPEADEPPMWWDYQ